MATTQDEIQQRQNYARNTLKWSEDRIQRATLVATAEMQQSQSTPTPTPTITPTEPPPVTEPSLSERVGRGAIGLGKSLIEPIAKFGRGLGGAVAARSKEIKKTDEAYKRLVDQSGQLTKKAIEAKNKGDFETARRLRDQAERNITMAQEYSSGQIVEAEKGKKELVKGAVGTAAYAIPFGKGPGVFTKALFPGAATGGMFSASEEEATPESVVGGALLGAGTAGVLYGFGKVAQRVAKGRAPAAFTKLQPVEELAPKAQKELTRTANNFLADNFVVPTKRATQLKPLNVAKEMVLDGFTDGSNFDTLRQVTDGVTGDTGIITRTSREMIGRMKGGIKLVDKEGQNIVVKSVNNLLKVAHDIPKNARKDILVEVTDMLDTAMQPKGGLNEYNPQVLNDVMRSLEGKAVKAKSLSTYLTKNPAAEARSNIYWAAAEEIEIALQKAAGKQNLVKDVVTPGVIDELAQFSPRLAQKLANAKTLAEVRSVAAPYVRLGQMMDLTEAASQTAFSKMGRQFEGIPSQLGSRIAGAPGYVGGKAVEAVAGPRIGRGIHTLGEDVGAGLKAAGGKTKQGIGAAGEFALSPGVEKAAVVAGFSPRPAEVRFPSDTEQPQDKQYPQPVSQDFPQDQETITGYTPEQLYAGYMNAQKSGYTAESKQLLGWYKDEVANQNRISGKKISSAIAIKIASADSALKILDQIESGFNSLKPSGFGPFARVGGVISGATGAVGFNERANAYKGLIKTLRPMLAKSLGNVGALTETEQQAAVSSLPNLGTSRGEANLYFSQYRQLIRQQRDSLINVTNQNQYTQFQSEPADVNFNQYATP